MSYDVAALKRAEERYAQSRTDRELEHARLVRNLNDRFPRLAEIDRELTACGLKIVQNVMNSTGSVENAVMAVKARAKALRAERAEILASNGYTPNLLEDRYACEACCDTGYVGSEMCGCLRQIYREEQYADLSELFALSAGDLNSFDPNQYPAVLPGADGVSPREYMAAVAERCRKYAAGFSAASPNLLFSGESGSGKTFFLAAIARGAVERNCSVLYYSAFSLSKMFEDERFAKTSEAADALARCRKVDLLLIDNLGTEMTTAYNASAIYQLLNDRLADKRPTVVTTAMNLQEIGTRYGGHVSARFHADYVLLPVYARSASNRRGRSILEI